ncbi:MAG: hypothetical protein ACXVEF_36370 [Polyangiales bacterium]
MRFACLLATSGLLLLTSREADACGTAVSWLGGSGSGSPDGQGWVYVEGGAAPGRDGERTSYGPIFHAGAGGSIYEGGAFVVGPTFSAIVRPTVATAPSSTDLALSVRTATLGFRSGFGAAFDVGGFTRVSGTRAFGPSGSITLGAPYGIQASWLVEMPKGGVPTQALLFGIDLARR